MQKTQQNVLLVGGGSGGHVVPIFEIYKILKTYEGLKLTIVGAGGEIEENFYGKIPGYHKIFAGKMHRVITWKNIIELFKLTIGFFQALFLLIDIRPKVIFAKGGYVSLPITFWARVLGITYYIHESDIEMGFSNRIAADGAKKIFTGFPAKFFQQYPWSSKVEFVGQLVRIPADTGHFEFGFDNNKPTLLVTGGSQGSKIVNDTVIASLDNLLPRYNIIHQTGTFSYDDATDAKDGLCSDMKSSYFVKDFFSFVDDKNMMYIAMKKADLIITRCGLNTLAEIAILRKPMIMVPYQHSSGDHQNKNAKEISAITGFPILHDKDLNPDVLTKLIDEIMAEKPNIETLSEKYERIFPQSGLKIVSDNILKEVL